MWWSCLLTYFLEQSPFEKLGTTLTNKNSIQEEIKSRLKSGNACYYSVQNLLSSSLLSKNLKIKIYRTIIVPRSSQSYPLYVKTGCAELLQQMCLCECGADSIVKQVRISWSVLFMERQNFITDFSMDSETYVEIWRKPSHCVTIQVYIFHVRHNSNIIKYTIVSANTF